ncbi:phage tail fiber protein [Ancylobacter sp. WKF20]|uniref:phage tail fiber domain-containing protein n=1 Tax=Ancylobacter sp. WKF20 TaxID=3039801 RepID=UPI002434515C|nr:phage tail fiber protein [Ancylobacter sp. WKF20]WGD31649.1 phage tail fiber protein [Ancylobacter sp. WKF20]
MAVLQTSLFYRGDGSTRRYPVAFDYRDRSYVYVTVNGAQVPFTWITSGQLELAAAPANGTLINIFRRTATGALVRFEDGSTVTGEDLNTTYEHVLDIVEETSDGVTAITEEARTALDNSASAVATAGQALSLAGVAATDAASAKAEAASAKTTSEEALEVALEASTTAADLFKVAQDLAEAVVIDDAADLPFDPAGTNLTATNVQDAVAAIALVTGAAEITTDKVKIAGTNETLTARFLAAESALSQAVEDIADKADAAATQTALDAKSPIGHGHSVSEVAGLSDALANKADQSATATALAGKAAATHTHSKSQVTGLDADLTWLSNGKYLAAVNFQGNGTVTIRKTYNVSAIGDLGSGTYRVYFATAMPDTNYMALLSCTNTGDGQQGQAPSVVHITSQQTTYIDLVTYTSNSVTQNNFDPNIVNLVIFRGT